MTGRPSTDGTRGDFPRVPRITLPTALLVRRPELRALKLPGAVLGLADLESA